MASVGCSVCISADSQPSVLQALQLRVKYEREREQFKSEEKRKRIQQEPTILQTLTREKMAMSNGVRVGTIVIGCTLLVLTFISVVCGCVAMGKMTSPAAVSIGLWGFYVSTQKYLE